MQINVTEILIDSFKVIASDIMSMIPLWMQIAFPILGLTIAVMKGINFFRQLMGTAEPDNKYVQNDGWDNEAWRDHMEEEFRNPQQKGKYDDMQWEDFEDQIEWAELEYE
jgi:hypothetical protein